MRIDAHQHFWRLSRGDYGWLTADLAPIHRDFLPGDLAPLLAQADVERTILVQAATTDAETDFLVSLAQSTPFVAGVVGWTDFEAPEAGARIAALARRPGLIGLRPMIQDIPDVEWMLSPRITSAIEAMIAADLRFDALVKPAHLPALQSFIQRYPALKIVIDHAAKPDIARGEHASWARAIAEIARNPAVVCKLSGLVTEAAPNPSADDLRPYVDTLLEVFGARRLMWGSDWPVLNLNGDYAGWRAMAEGLLATLADDDREWIFGKTAAAFYGV
jgi:L-fuconolactonase